MQRLNLPESFVQVVVNQMAGTMFLTNLPGLKSLSFCNGKFQVDDMLIWIPHRGPIGNINIATWISMLQISTFCLGFTLLVHTFGQRLQLGLCADNSNVSCEEELNMILNDFIAYLYSIHSEVEE